MEVITSGDRDSKGMLSDLVFELVHVVLNRDSIISLKMRSACLSQLDESVFFRDLVSVAGGFIIGVGVRAGANSTTIFRQPMGSTFESATIATSVDGIAGD